MKKTHAYTFCVSLMLILSFFSSAAAQERNLFNAVSISPGIGFEYISRTINWDDDQYTSKLKSNYFTFDTEIELRSGLFVRAVFGLTTSNYESLVFRQLPLSVELGREIGNIGGYLFGADIKKSIIHSEDLRVDLLGQFFYGIGSKKEWEIPDLSVEGTVEGRPNWMSLALGPVFTYTGFDTFFPYLYLNFNKFWGRFRMDETIQDLERSEIKKIKGESSFCISLGLTYKVTESLSLKSEAKFLPYKDGIDSGIVIKAMYSFY
jgi:hypothetical protein